ncbi:MAG TPA: RNA methyltransferase [Isosphaeraceae bacterium]|jgi:tRNA G18 (ribose-2'-O)-methylase SpoU|nr:RNA methyltransferase [Isosphaeraceae bacterium]
MPRVLIDRLDDPRIAIYRNLKATNLTRHTDLFVVEGEKLLDRLRQSRFPLASVLVTDRHEPRLASRVPDDVPRYVVPHALIDAIVGFRYHLGVLASGRRRPWPGLDETIRAAGPRLALIICPQLDSPENLGSIVRIGDVFGVDAVVVSDRCPDALSRRVLRVSMGSSLRLPVIESDDLKHDVAQLGSEWAIQRIAAVADPSAEPFDAPPRADRLALFLGSEAHGLAPEWIERCDRRVTIPMRPGAESLNVAVAAGILLHYYLRRE